MHSRAVHFSIFNLHLPPRAAIIVFLNQPRAIFLDRDGTVIQEKEYLHRPEQVEILPGAAAALRRLREAGFRLFIVSNQSGVGRDGSPWRMLPWFTPASPPNWPARARVSTEYMSPPKPRSNPPAPANRHPNSFSTPAMNSASAWKTVSLWGTK